MKEQNILTDLVRKQAEKYGSREAVATAPSASAGTTAEAMSWNDFAEKVTDLAHALETLGIQPHNMLATITHNCAEALIIDFAAYRNRAVPVSIYATSGREQIRFIIRDAGARIIFVGDQSHYNSVRAIAPDCPELYKIVIIDPSVRIEPDDHMSMYFGEMLALGRNANELSRAVVERRTAEATPQDIATLVYTSGTTGEPKGAILPHSCFNSALFFHTRRLDYLTDADSSVCFLPLSHIFEKAWSYFCLMTGMHITINRDPREVQDTLRLVRPTALCAVPRFWEKVYAGIQSKLTRVSSFKRALMKMAVKVGTRRNLEYVRFGRRVPFFLRLQYAFFYNQIFRPMQKVVGVDRGVIFPTAGAPLAPEITSYLLACGIPIVIGYGLSETTATVSFYPPKAYQIASIGTVMEGVNVCISPEGEILVNGPTVMRGYYGRPEESAKAFTPDGKWFRTGDAGYFDEQGQLILTERIKDLFKTSNGKYVAPQAVESRLSTDPLFEQVALIGDRRKYVSALIVPSREIVEEFAKGIDLNVSDYKSLLSNPRIIEWVESKIKALTADLARHEQIKRFTLLPEPFTTEKGELTNTLKLRRRVILENYADTIEKMYNA
ncbi:MAG: long-chain fatty acid--CoA ligase [Muribaculaceae bacterium]|nr:long-chain fatty acid--CoA ligase [Muribaculaceae bacterium]